MPYINEIFKRFLDGKCTPEELSILLRYFELDQYTDQLENLVEQELVKPEDEQYFPTHIDEMVEHNRVIFLDRILERAQYRRRIRKLYVWLPVAGVICLVSAMVLYINTHRSEEIPVVQQHDVSPGTNRAVMTLADGKTIELSEQKEGVVVVNGAIEYSDGNEIVQTNDVQYAILATPRAGQYQVTLPDGTKVSLNAESSLRYPTTFAGNERRVELIGEAYFDVAKSRNSKGELIPFIVESDRQKIEVLGTRFNVNGYLDNEFIQTTLLEGSVRVSTANAQDERLLKPGEQAIVGKGKMDIQPVDVESIIAWKNGDFVFDQEDLQSVMKKIARWYDVEVIYPLSNGDIKFSGVISRSRNLSEVLKMMELTGEVTFKIEGRRVFIMV